MCSISSSCPLDLTGPLWSSPFLPRALDRCCEANIVQVNPTLDIISDGTRSLPMLMVAYKSSRIRRIAFFFFCLRF